MIFFKQYGMGWYYLKCDNPNLTLIEIIKSKTNEINIFFLSDFSHLNYNCNK